VDLQSRITGPTFVKVWDTPDSTYSERMKHVVEPHLTLQRTSKIDQFNEIVRLEGVDFIMGNTTQVSYGLTNRMYARLAADSGAGAIRQILTVGLTQTYYTNDQAAQFDRRFSTSFNDTSPSNFSPVTLTVRGVPTDDLSTSMRAEYDTKFNALRTIGINGTYDFKNLIQATAGWSQRRLVEDLEGFNNPHQSDHYLHAQTRVQNRGNTLGGSYTMHYDLLRGRLLQQGVGVYYNAQCCGVSVDYQEFNFQGIGQRAPVPQDHRLNFSFTLAGLNTFTSAFGANGGSR
jgi:lipopolysaccharide assembly outer membrane protein LptD (OstA)